MFANNLLSQNMFYVTLICNGTQQIGQHFIVFDASFILRYFSDEYFSYIHRCSWHFFEMIISAKWIVACAFGHVCQQQV